jgi:hypothetical protein
MAMVRSHTAAAADLLLLMLVVLPQLCCDCAT